jgi:hypothetical protein
LETINEIKSSFKFNDSIIRNLVLNARKAHQEPSILLSQTKEDNEKDSYQEAREAANKAVDQEAKAASKSSEVSSEEPVKAKEASTEEVKEESK